MVLTCRIWAAVRGEDVRIASILLLQLLHIEGSARRLAFDDLAAREWTTTGFKFPSRVNFCLQVGCNPGEYLQLLYITGVYNFFDTKKNWLLSEKIT